jgi:pentatricopeptide repeat protein
MCAYEQTPFKVDGIHMSLLKNILVDMYAKRGSVEDAWRLFQHLMPS